MASGLTGHTKIRHAVIDFEASGLGWGSFPIEVAWGWLDTFEVDSYLIKPTDEWLETGLWDWYAEAEIHRISRDRLVAEGTPVTVVTERMMTALSEHAVYSDAPPFDGDWLDTLFEAVGRKPPVRIESIDGFFCDRFDIEFVETAKEAAKLSCPPTHRAADDVRHLLEVFRLASARSQ